MSTLGIFNSTNFNPEDVMLQSFQGAVFKRFPGGSMPLLGFTALTKTGTLNVPTHTWKIEQQEFPHTATTASVAAAAKGTALEFLLLMLRNSQMAWLFKLMERMNTFVCKV